MSFSLAPICNGWQAFGITGLPLNAGLLYTYAAGTTTPQATFTTSIGNVQNSNPIVLGADGRPPQEIWLQDGLSYKFQLNDSLNNPIATYDNIQSIGTLINNFVTSTAFLTQADGRYPIYVGTAGGSADALTATVATNITALYNGMVVSLDAIAANATATPTFTLTLGSTVTATQTIVDYNLQPLQAGAIAGVGHKIFLGANLTQGKWVLMNPQPVVASAGTVSRRQTALIGPVDVSGFPSFLPQTATGLTLTTQNITGIETVQTGTATFTNGSAVIGWVGHTLVANQAVSFTTTGGLPTNFVVGTVYYVSSTGLVANQFEVAATPGGTPISAGSAGTGVQSVFAGVQLPLTATAYFGNDGITGELNVVGQTTANFSFPTLTNGTTNYLYSTISSLGAFTHFATTLAPVIGYGVITAPSITNGQITVDTVRGEVYLGNGSTASETNLVIWGTATTAGGNITATQIYNYGKPPTFASKKSGTLLKRTVYNTAGTFTWVKSAQTTAINVIVCGGSGGGGGGGNTGTPGGPGGNGGTSSFGSISNGIGVGTGGDINSTRSVAGGLGGAGGANGAAGADGAFANGGAGGLTGVGGSTAGGGGGGGASAYAPGGAGGQAIGVGSGTGGAGGLGCGGVSFGLLDASGFIVQTVTVGAGGAAGTGNGASAGSAGIVIVEEYA